MTRARAIELLKGIQFCCDFDDCTNAWDCDECVDAFNMAIEALEQQETLQNLTKPNKSDLISRQNAIEAIASRDKTNGTVKMFTGRQVNEILNSLPSVEPKTNMKSWNGLYIKVYADDDPQDKAEKMYQICGDIAELSEVAEFLKEYCDIPSAEPKRGEWERFSYSDGDVMECTNCGYRDWRDRWLEDEAHNYCPNCGARMEGEEG